MNTWRKIAINVVSVMNVLLIYLFVSINQGSTVDGRWQTFCSSVQFIVQCWYVYVLRFAGLGMARGVRTCNTGKREPESSIGGCVRNGHFMFWSSVDRSTCACTWILFKSIVPETVYWTLVLRFLNNFTEKMKETN